MNWHVKKKYILSLLPCRIHDAIHAWKALVKSGSEWSWHYPHHLFVLTQAFLLFSMTKLVSCVNCVPLLFPKSFRVFSRVICCIWCTKDQELIIVLKSGLISNPDQNGTRHNQNGTRQKVGTFMKIRRSPVSSDVRKAWRHNQTTGMKRFLELWTQLCIDLI